MVCVSFGPQHNGHVIIWLKCVQMARSCKTDRSSREERVLVTEAGSHRPFIPIHFKQEDLVSDSDSIHIISLQVLFPFENRAICNHKSRTQSALRADDGRQNLSARTKYFLLVSDLCIFSSGGSPASLVCF